MDVTEARGLLALALDVEANAAGPDAAAWTRRLEPRADDIAEAAEALLADDVASALDLVGALSVFWQDVGRVGDGRALTERVLDAAGGSGIGRAGARAHLVLGELAFRQGDQAVAASESARARELAEGVGDGWVAGRAELNLARVAFRDGDAPRIAEHAQRVVDGAAGNARLLAGGTHMLAWAAYTAGDVDRALQLFEQNAARYRELGNHIGEASELANIADLALEHGDLEAARRGLRAALEVPGVTESSYLAPSLVRSAGVLAGLIGDGELAWRLLTGADALYDRFELVADPGDELTPRVREQVVAVLPADERSRIEAAASAASLEDLVADSRAALDRS